MTHPLEYNFCKWRLYMVQENNSVIVDVLYGSQSEKSNCCGYCKLKHKYLTVRQMKTKQCLGKQCNALSKIEEHPFWNYRDRKLKEKKMNRQGFNVSIGRILIEAKRPVIDEGMNKILTAMLGFDTTELLRSIS